MKPSAIQSGWTALHFSCTQGRMSSAEILIAHGADTTIKGKGKVFPEAVYRSLLILLSTVKYRTIKPL
jgi:ankyrin repeat protein